ncbi:MAG: permease [candidate division CPR2 bacterium GW2011_GWC1_39_9]|uniref:Permease n=1 Tax=candidate division CPR2 bacterium GW2011_GWC2_39_10 TaxID=1618345 RepID=A0A0G0LS38_UNCC2|nr:MAG: Permease [candidate division CPR2 bacterium GW2011_GWC2_39_10]KKR32990.1 MAG: permease [candidate division CPR2 bacterium GW2011_GWC1_39_9]
MRRELLGGYKLDIFHPIQVFADWFSYGILGLTTETHLGAAVNFFVYDAIKIVLLLIVINYFMAIVRHYLPVEKIRDFLTSRKFYGADYLLASIFGCITPFCSCSSIPLFIGFLRAKIPLGVTFAFLITSPLVNEAAVAVFLGVWGWKITLLYVLAGITVGTIGGFILGKLKLENQVADFVWQVQVNQAQTSKKEKPSKKALFKIFSKEAFSITIKIIPYVLIGILIGAFIHGFVPTGYFEEFIAKDSIFAVPLAVIIAVPMYANATGAIPIVQSLVDKGIPLGTALAFMMATVGLSLPAAMILKKVMSVKLLAIFFGITALGMMVIGYLFKAIL